MKKLNTDGRPYDESELAELARLAGIERRDYKSYIVCDEGHVFTRVQIPLTQHDCPKCRSRWNISPLLDILCSRPQVGVAAIVTRGDGMVLMGKRKGSHGAGTWSFPGGRMEYGESPDEAARRELLEETGLLPSGFGKETSFTNDVFRNEGFHYITIFVTLVVLPQQRPSVREPDKCEEWRWFDWDGMPPHDRLFLPIRNLLRTGYRPPL